MSRAFIIHGWGSGPDKDWIPWMTSALNNKGYETVVPLMPDTEIPKINPWVSKLSQLVGNTDPTDIFIGHSIGCQTILRLLEKLPSPQKVKKVLLIAPWFELTNLEDDQMWQIADPWLKTPINFSQVVNKANEFITVFSDNDPWVPFDINLQLFKERLNPTIITLSHRGHFTQDEGITQIPELLDLI